jgi:hypothetical protein
LQQLTMGDCVRLVPFLPGPRASSLPLWLTWFWSTNRSLLQLPLSTGYHSTAEHSLRMLTSVRRLSPGRMLLATVFRLTCMMTVLRMSSGMNYVSFYNLVRTGNRTFPWTVRLWYCALARCCLAMDYSALSIPRQRPVITDTRLAKSRVAMDHSGFEASCHYMIIPRADKTQL